MHKKILIVDEDLATVTLKKSIFNFHNFDVEMASTGAEALEKAKKGGVDIILSDTPVPEMAGDEFIKTIKNDQDTKDIPIVMLASFSIKNEGRRFRSKGVAAYMLKPLDVEKLIKKVKHLVNKSIIYSYN